MSRSAAKSAANAFSYPPKQIKSYASLPFIVRNSKAIPGFSAKFSVDRHYLHSSNIILQLKHHHIHERTSQSWHTQTAPLWWSCITASNDGTKKRVIRSYLARKLRIAFVESLRKEGYAKDGTRLPGLTPGRDLVGTLQLSPDFSLYTMAPGAAQSSTDNLVKQILQIASGNRPPKGGEKKTRKREQDAANAFPTVRRTGKSSVLGSSSNTREHGLRSRQ